MIKEMRARLDPERSQQVFDLLAEMLRKGAESNLGQLEFIDVSAVAGNLKDGAPDKLEKLSAAAFKVLSDNIKDPNIFFQQDDDNFVVVFVALDAEEAGRISAACGEAILDVLRDDYGIDCFKAKIDVKPLSLDDVLALSRQMAARASGASTDDQTASAPKSQMTYQAMWRASKKLIGVYLASPLAKTMDGDVLRGHAVLENPDDLRKVAAFDQANIIAAARAIDAGIAAGEKFLLIVPVSMKAFQQSSLMPFYRKTFDSLPTTVLKRLSVQATAISPRMNARQLGLNINILSSACESVVADLPINAGGVAGLLNARLGAVGASVANRPNASMPVGAALQNFVRATRGYETSLYLLDIDDEAVASRALSLGYEYLSGPFIGPDLAKPESATLAKFEDLAARQSEAA